MAHMIENNQIAWNTVNGKPWHGLGTEVPAGTSGAEMLRLAGLDFPVEAMDIELAGFAGSDFLAGYKAIGRADTHKVFGVQSKRYNIHQNIDLINVFSEYCAAGHAQMDVVGALRGGAVIWALAKLNGGTKLTIKGTDHIGGYILMVGSHDGTLPTSAFATQQRAVCNNTLFPAMRSGRMGFKMKHSKAWDENCTIAAREQMGIAIEGIQKFNSQAETFASVNIDRKGQIEFISQLLDGKCLLDQVVDNSAPIDASLSGASLLDSIIDARPTVDLGSDDSKLNRVGKSILDCILNSPGSELASANGTLWGAINGVSYYTDHVASRTADSRLYNAYFGTSVDLKQSAVDVAQQMAGIN
jgi:phage/plasmid-like protein (TIGR03299 family)